MAKRRVRSEQERGGLSRREFAYSLAAAPLLLQTESCQQAEYAGGLTDIEGIRVGHETLTKRPTGCTVILFEEGATAGVDVRGSAPGSRELALLDPVNTVQEIHGLALAGGSAFGLDVAAGVVSYLEGKKIGFPMRGGVVPIVPAAVLYDLGIGDPSIRPNRNSGHLACLNATSGPIAEGTVGAGTGATVGKLFGSSRSMKGGVGSFGLAVGELQIAALAAVNARGDIIDYSTGKIVAGARTEDGRKLVDTIRTLREGTPTPTAQQGENTTLVVVATNAAFSKTEMTKIAQMAQDGMARTINPAHTPLDGDMVFAVSTGQLSGADLGLVGALAAEATAHAILRGVRQASSLPHYPAACDFGEA